MTGMGLNLNEDLKDQIKKKGFSIQINRVKVKFLLIGSGSF